MSATLLKRRLMTVFMIAFLTSTLLVTYFTHEVAASATPTISIYPSRGYVGDSVQVNGIIDTNGTYKIFFDEELVANGTASPEKTVNTTFFVPHRFEGNYTVKLHDVTAGTNSTPAYFKIDTKYNIDHQTQLMEGQSATIKVSVTGGESNKTYWANVTVTPPPPLIATYYNSSLHLANTTRPGEYVVKSIYPRDFGSGAHTNYTGTYRIASNITLETTFLKVGLTNATQYHRSNTVAIQGAGYTQPNERAWINITFAGLTINSTNVPAVGGIVKANWLIPKTAACGIYNVTITSSTSLATIKSIRDTQVFIVGFLCEIQVLNVDNKVTSGVYVAAYNVTSGSIVSDSTSDSSGLANLWLEPYNYSVKAFSSNIQVGYIPTLNIAENTTLTLKCQLANIDVCVKDNLGNPLPFISVNLIYAGQIYGQNVSGTKTLETNSTGIADFQNAFSYINCSIEAKRFGSIFNTTIIGNLTSSQWINITCPTYALSVHVVDSQGLPLQGVHMNVTEWSSGLLVENKTWITDIHGNVPLNLTFGKYTIRIYNYSADINGIVILNERTINLIENGMTENISCKIVNLSPSVYVVDYFGNPIPDAEIKIERFSEIEQRWIEITSRKTDSNGVASLPTTGGQYLISVYVMGQIGGIKSIYIDRTSTLVFKIDKYTTIAGLAIETTQLVVCITLGLLILSIGVILTYKKILPKIMKT